MVSPPQSVGGLSQSTPLPGLWRQSPRSVDRSTHLLMLLWPFRVVVQLVFISLLSLAAAGSLAKAQLRKVDLTEGGGGV